MKEKFKKEVLESVDFVLSNLSSEMLYMVIKPIVNLARPELEKMLAEKPEDVYNWLKTANEKISVALKSYNEV